MRLLALLIAIAAPSFASALGTEMPARPAPGHAAALAAFRAPRMAPTDIVVLPAPMAKAAASAEEPDGRTRVATVRASKAAHRAMDTRGGWICREASRRFGKCRLAREADFWARFRCSKSARRVPTAGRVDGGRSHPRCGSLDAVDRGATQVIEVFSRFSRRRRAFARRGRALHRFASPRPRAPAPLPTMRPYRYRAGGGASPSASARSRYEAAFFDGGSIRLLARSSTPRVSSPYVLTANH